MTTQQDRNLTDDECVTPPHSWLKDKVDVFENNMDNVLWIPKREANQPYRISLLYDDQKEIVATVMDTLYDWLHCKNYQVFRPLRLTVNGSGGSGKSVVINTIVSAMRTMFGVNDVVKVVAPTGTAAFNVGGETFHHLLGNRVTKKQYTPKSMGTEKRLGLIKKFKTLLCLIIDERSLINSKDLGTAERQIAETIYGGGPLCDVAFGGLPILVLFGDDYNCP